MYSKQLYGCIRYRYSFALKYICSLKIDMKSENVIALRQGNVIFCKKLYVEERFVNAFLKGNFIYLMPKMFENPFWIFDIKKEIFIRDVQWDAICRESDFSGLIRNAEMDIKGKIIFTIDNSNMLFSYNEEKQEINKICIGSSDINLKCIIIIDKKYYITPDNKRCLFVFDTDKDNIEEIKLEINKSDSYIREIFVKDKLFLQTEDSLDVFDVSTEKFDCHVEMPSGFSNDILGSTLFHAGFYFDKKFYLLPYGANMLLEIDENFDCKSKIIEIENSDVIYLAPIHEKEISLKDFLLYVEKDYEKNSVIPRNELYGISIYNEIKTC